MLSAGFSRLSSNSRSSPGNRHVRTAQCPVPERLLGGSLREAAARGAFPRPRPLFSGRAGRELAGLQPPSPRLPSAPVVTCGRCSHNSGRGRREMPRGRVSPWFLPLTLPPPPLAAPFLCIPLRLAASAPNQPHGGSLFDRSLLHLFPPHTRVIDLFIYFPGTLPLNLFESPDLNVPIIKTYGC